MLTLKGNHRPVRCLAFSPDGATLASAVRKSHTVSLWDLGKSDKRSFLRGAGGPVSTLAFAPGGGQLAAGGGYHVGLVVWDLATRALRRVTSRGNHRAVAFSPDGQTLATSHYHWG